MARFTVPSSPAKNVLVLDTFVGADFTNDPSSVGQSQSPDIVNMIRDVPGKIRKCMGYHTIGHYSGRINGFHIVDGEKGILHAGTNLYFNDDCIYFNMADEKSRSWKCGDKLMIADGSELIMFDGENAYPASEFAYIPTITISKTPSGGGTSYEELNLIQSGFTEQFLGTEEDTAYHMTFDMLDKKPLSVLVMDSEGNWQTKKEDVDYSADYENGIVNFTKAPGKSPITGEDNVKITAFKTIEGYAERINKCKIGIQYGVNGAKDRLFLSGNPDFINYDWFCQMNDTSYWPDTNYGVIGSNRSAILGYSIINNCLATHKDENEEEQSIVLRSGELNKDTVIFRIVNSLQAESAIAIDSFAYLKTEPVYLTRQGIHAITTPDSGEKYSQNRSFYLDGKLLQEKNMEDAVCCIHNDMYWLCLNGVAYILDGLQQLRTDASEPYSTRQYAGFYRTNLPIRVIWNDKNTIYFGTENGEVCKFYTDVKDSNSYSDNGENVSAYFETPEFVGQLFYKNKTFSHLALSILNDTDTSIKVEVNKNGNWVSIFDKEIPFSKTKVVPKKLRLKKLDSVKFRFINDKKEPFEIYDIGIEYMQNGNKK